MKRASSIFIIFLFFSPVATAQNVGIGTKEPLNNLHAEGNFLVTIPTRATVLPPRADQTKTLLNDVTLASGYSDSTYRIFDPGGPDGNYSGNLQCFFLYQQLDFSIAAIELIAESIDLGPGDSLIIKESSSSTSSFIAVGNGYSNTGKWVFNSRHIHITFKSNGDGVNGAGFSLLMRRLYTAPVPPSILGLKFMGMFFNASNGAFRSGVINNTSQGDYSTGMGADAIASGYLSVAIGSGNIARASHSTALGRSAEASGVNAIAIGYNAVASGSAARTFGYYSTASGNYSTAIGNYVSTNEEEGALVIGDRSTTTVMNAVTPNSFRARFAGGYRFYTSSDLTTNALLSAGSNAWSTSSDKRLKENFNAVDGESFLQKIAAMKLTSWNYKSQDATRFRHYGPMAQDFYAAFGNDGIGTIGNDTTINQADFDGVNLIAIQALEKRTATRQKEQQAANQALKKELEELKAMLQRLQKELRVMKNKQQ